MITIKIFQVRRDIDEEEQIKVVFRDYDFVNERNPDILRRDFHKYYTEVYEYDEEDAQNTNILLNELYRKFQHDSEDCPDDFNGHSLSVSDVVFVDDTMYYCDNIGFEQIE